MIVEPKNKLAKDIVDILCGLWEDGPEGIANEIVDLVAAQRHGTNDEPRFQRVTDPATLAKAAAIMEAQRGKPG
jgi:hypothetical protein